MSYKSAKEKTHAYWKKNKVMKFDDRPTKSELVCPNVQAKFLSSCVLPTGYKWKQIIINDNEMETVVNFINTYFYDDNQQFRQQYTRESLHWQLGDDGKFLVVCDENDNICGTIGYTTKKVQIWESDVDATQAFFMTVKPEHRNKGLAKVLIDEVAHMSTMNKINIGVFCTNIIVPSPIVQLRHYARPLNYKYLHENKFILIDDIDQEFAHNRTKIKLKPDKNYIVANKTDENIQIVYDLYVRHMKSYNVHQIMTKNEVAHYFFDDRYVTTIIIYNNNAPVDFVTYNHYDLINKENGNTIKCSNILMYSSIKTNEDIIIINVLKQISFDGYHVAFMSDMMGNSDVLLSSQKFADEDTDDEEQHSAFDLNFLKIGKKTMLNLFNWKCPLMKPTMVSWLLF